jgi:hypothetical protein
MTKLFNEIKSKLSVDYKQLFRAIIGGKSKKRNIFFTLGTILFTAGILGYLIYSQWDVLIKYPWKIQPASIGWAFIVYSIILFFNVLTWTSIMKSLGSKVSLGTHFRSTCISALGKRLPGTFWYVVWRAEIYREDVSARLIAFSSGVEMAVTVVAAGITCCLFSISLIMQYQYSIVGIIIVLLVSLIILHPRVIQWILKKLKVETIQIPYKNMLLWISLYIIIWIMVGILLFAIGNIFAPISWDKISYFIGSVALTGILSRLLLFSPSTFGFGEVSLSLLLSNFLPSSLAVIIAISNRIIIIIFEILWAVFSLTLSHSKILQSK